MKCLVYCAILLVVMVSHSNSFVIDEPCRTDAYPPPANTVIPTVVLNLDLEPEQRWKEIVGTKKAELQDLLEAIKQLVPEKIMNLITIGMDKIEQWLPPTYAGEIKGVAEAAGLPLGEAVLYNVFYEIFTACTSIVGHDTQGKLYHARNLDFGLMLGWDDKTNTWLVSEKLRKLMLVVDYQKGGKTVFKALHFVGYVGVLTAVKQNAFTLTMNERFALDGGFMGIIEWLLGVSNGQWMGFLTRDVMLNATSFSEAKALLTNTELLAPAYFILGGLHAGEEAVITRARKKADDVWTTNLNKKEWYLLETNYDHWKDVFVLDDRRTPGNNCMRNMTQERMSFKGLFNVLSTRSSLNKLTTYTALMQVNDGKIEAYVQNCPDPCWPW